MTDTAKLVEVTTLSEMLETAKSSLANCERMLELLQPEWAKFEARTGHNVYVARDYADHLSAARWHRKEIAALSFALTQSEARRKADVAEALTPSGATKYAYSGEFKFTEVVGFDEDGSEIIQEITVPWTTIKEIMAAIAIRAAQQETEHG